MRLRQYIEDRKKLWRFQNDLAYGNIAVDWRDVFVTQQRRILTGQSEPNSFPLSDIGLDDPHRRQVGMRIQLGNHWRPNLDRAMARPRDTVNDEFRRIIERQLENMPSCKGVRDCLNYVRELWHKDICKGIASWRQQRDLLLSMAHSVNEYEAGRMLNFVMPDIPPLEARTPFHEIVDEMVKGLDAESTLKRWVELLEDDSVNLCASVSIRTAFEAALLWKWRTELRPTNPDTFHEGFGLSRQNDIDHISAFAPYVDALTTDKKTHNLCKDEVVANELAQFPCKIFSTSNYDEFEAWLDTLLVEPETPDIRAQ